MTTIFLIKDVRSGHLSFAEAYEVFWKKIDDDKTPFHQYRPRFFCSGKFDCFVGSVPPFCTE